MEASSYAQALELDKAGSWRVWLGNRDYDKLGPFLRSAAAWQKVIESSQETSLEPALVLRVRALLFERTVDVLFGNAPPGELRGDSLYHSLEQDAEDWDLLSAQGSSELCSLQTKHGLKPQDLKRKPKLRKRKFWAAELRAEDTERAQQEAKELLKSALGRVLDNLRNLGDKSSPFLRPVSKEEAWDYDKFIKHPMDLATMGQKLQEDKYSTKEDFQADIDLIVANCFKYNGQASLLSKHVGILQAKAQHLLSEITTFSLPPVPSVNGISNQEDEFASSSEEEEEQRPGYRAEEGNNGAFSGGGLEQELWYVQWLKSVSLQRMQRLAERAAQRKLPFPERPAPLRSSGGMAAYLTAAAAAAPPPPPPYHPPPPPAPAAPALLKPPPSLPTSPPTFVTTAASSRAAAIAAASAAATAAAIQQRQASGSAAGSGAGPGGSSKGGGPKTSLLKGMAAESKGGKEAEVKAFMPEVDFPVDCVPELCWVDATRGGVAGGEAKAMGGVVVRGGKGAGLKAALELVRKGKRERPAKVWSEEGLMMAQKQVVAQVLGKEGCEGAKAGALDVLAELLGCHLAKLGRTLHALQDRYARYAAPDVALGAALNAFGGSTLAELKAYVRGGSHPEAPPASPPLDLPEVLLHLPQLQLPEGVPKGAAQVPVEEGGVHAGFKAPPDRPPQVNLPRRAEVAGGKGGLQGPLEPEAPPHGGNLTEGAAPLQEGPPPVGDLTRQPSLEEMTAGNARKRKAPGTGGSRQRKGHTSPPTGPLSPPMLVGSPGSQLSPSPRAGGSFSAGGVLRSPSGRGARPSPVISPMSPPLGYPPPRQPPPMMLTPGHPYSGPTHAPPIAYGLPYNAPPGPMHAVPYSPVGGVSPYGASGEMMLGAAQPLEVPQRTSNKQG